MQANESRNYNLIEFLSKSSTIESFVKLLFCATLAYFLYVSACNLNQPILEGNGFRQTQTALTAYYLQKYGFSFQYETPVIGMGWSIPFEFPIYQEIVALVSSFGIELTMAGRLVSLLFSVLTCVPIYKSLQRIGLSSTIGFYACTLYLSAPVYMFWSGTFMIESAAVFFSTLFVYYFIRIMQRDWSSRTLLISAFLLSIGLLQKITTILPILLIVMLIFVFYTIRIEDLKKSRKFLYGVLLSVIIPLLIAYAWVAYSDHIKILNPIGESLTSKALAGWNYGSWDQRISKAFWIDLVYERVVKSSSFYIMGLVSIALLIYFGKSSKEKIVVSVAFAMFLMPFFMFANLHINHDYYQVANVIYLSVAVGVAVCTLCTNFLNNKKPIAFLILVCFVGSNIHFFNSRYAQVRFAEINEGNSRTLKLTSYLRNNTPAGMPIVVYGFDWSSEVAFYSQRKALTLPWGRWDLEAITMPEKFLKNEIPSVYVICPNKNYDSIKSAINAKYSNAQFTKVADCEIFKI